LDSIGYMQVHLRLYKGGELYDTTAINAYRECYSTNTELINVEHQVVVDESKVHDLVHQVWVKVNESDMKFLLHIPIHKSDEWEQIVLDGNYTLGFYCILGELSSANSR